MRTWMKKRPLVSFFVLAYLLSWLIWVPLAIVFNRLAEPPEELLLFVGIYGASGAGLIMTRVVEGKGGIRKLLRRYLDWRVGLQWYGVMFFAMPVLIVAAMAIYTLQGNAIGRAVFRLHLAQHDRIVVGLQSPTALPQVAAICALARPVL